MDESLVVFTRTRAIELTGLTAGQLDYWAETGLVRPQIEHRLSERNSVRLYDYKDLLGLLIIVELHRRNLSLQYIRQIVEHVRDEGAQLSEVPLAVAGSRVHAQNRDGDWEDAHRNQQIFEDILDLEPLKAKVRRAVRRDPSTVGNVEKRRGALGSKLVVAGTRVPVDTVRRYLARGVPDDEILQAYPNLERVDLEEVRLLASA